MRQRVVERGGELFEEGGVNKPEATFGIKVGIRARDKTERFLPMLRTNDVKTGSQTRRETTKCHRSARGVFEAY